MNIEGADQTELMCFSSPYIGIKGFLRMLIIFISFSLYDMQHEKPVFEVSDMVKHMLACPTTEVIYYGLNFWV